MWLILGGKGQLGSSFAEVLTRRGIPHAVEGRFECDINDTDAVSRTIARHDATVVVNCAAWTAVDAAEDDEAGASLINCDGARSVARACASTSVPLVHISTDYVFAGSPGEPHDEDSPTAPVSAYGRTKLCGEQAVASVHPSSYVVRTAWLYSRYGANFAKTMMRRAAAGAPVRVVDDQVGQPTHAVDLAEHIIELVTAGAPFGTYHGTNSGAASWYDFAREIYRLAACDISLVTPVPSTEYPTRAVRPANSVLGHDRTLAAGVNEMRNWQEALAAAISGVYEEIRGETGS